MLAILFQEKTKKNARFPKKCRKNASIIEKGLDVDSEPGWKVREKIRVLLLPDRAKLSL